MSEETRQWAAHVRGSKRAWLAAFIGNALLLFVLLGLPHLRGRARARAAWSHYVRFAECLYGDASYARGFGDQPSPLAGAAFAARARAERGDWPNRCAPTLAAVAPANAIFLMPSLKGAEADVRAAVGIVTDALAALPPSVPASVRLAIRPVLSVNLLRTALEAYASQAGLLDAPTLPAQKQVPSTLSVPGNIPLYAGAEAVVSLLGTDQVLQVIGLDRTGISYVELTNRLDVTSRLVRPKLLRDVLLVEGRPVLLWGMRSERCAHGSCLGKTTGFAWGSFPLTALPPPRYLGAHMSGRPDRSLLVQGDQLSMLAERAQDELELRTFRVPAAALEPSLLEDMPPVRPAAAWTASLPRDALLVATDAEPLALSVRSDGAGAELQIASRRGSSLSQRIEGKGAPWVTASRCGQANRVAFVFGTAEELALGTVENGAVYVWPALALRARGAVHAHDRTRDNVQPTCRQDGVLAFAVVGDQKLVSVHCAAPREPCVQRTVAEGVASFSWADTAQGPVVAYAGGPEAPQVRVRRLDLVGAARAAESVPAACWAPRSGMCGHPSLTMVGARLVLAARDDTDVLALESPDLGLHWRTLYGTKPHAPWSR